jgi:hypothetical protein
MTKENKRYSKNFTSWDFKYIEPESDLVKVLQALRDKTGDSITISNGAREIEDHIRIYKDLESQNKLGGKKWYDAIPWGSRHLPTFETSKLRAVDIKAVKERGDNGKVKSFYKGSELYEFLKKIQEDLSLYLGIGVGKEYCHIDVDRTKDTVWYYSY